MNWSVTYRTSNGEQTTEVFQASSRTELFSILQEKGLSAIRIEASKGKRSLPAVPSFGKSGWEVPLFVMLSIGAVCSIIYYLTVRDGETVSSADEGKIRPKAIIPEAFPTPKRQSAVNTPDEALVEKQLSKRERDLKQIRDLYGDNVPDNMKAVVYFLEHPPKRVSKSRTRNPTLDILRNGKSQALHSPNLAPTL